MTVQQIQEISFLRDSVRYTIHVERNADGVMWGTWHCHDCGSGGTANKSSTDLTLAVETAKESLEAHHQMYHATV